MNGLRAVVLACWWFSFQTAWIPDISFPAGALWVLDVSWVSQLDSGSIGVVVSSQLNLMLIPGSNVPSAVIGGPLRAKSHVAKW